MKLSIKSDTLKQTKWYEYATRFAFGGLVTVATGLIAHKYGPVVGGLFLAFPAIFPASVSLVEKHKRQKEEKDGHDGNESAKKAAAVDAAGAALGSIGLIAFAIVVWRFSTLLPAWVMLILALFSWVVVSLIAWAVRQRM